jgi:hypothetical protein
VTNARGYDQPYHVQRSAVRETGVQVDAWASPVTMMHTTWIIAGVTVGWPRIAPRSCARADALQSRTAPTTRRDRGETRPAAMTAAWLQHRAAHCRTVKV